MNKNPFIYLLSPLAAIYGSIIFLRNRLFDWNLIPSKEYDIPVISVGNLRIGGTGKTPHIEYLVNILSPEFRCAVLSRGYKRKTRGFYLAGESSDAQSIGDEPKQMALKFPNILVAVDENRQRGIEKLLSLPQPPDIILLDDAFQHRYVKAGLSILLIDYNFPLKDDYLLPMGRLREPASSLSRADLILITKSPDNLKAIERRIIVSDIKPLPLQHLFFTNLTAEEYRPVFESGSDPLPDRSLKPEILLVTGIANPRDVKRFARNMSPRIHEMFFPDHHFYSAADINRINKKFSELEPGNRLVLTTEKDATRLRLSEGLIPELMRSMYYIPVRVGFLNDDEENFKNQIVRYARSNKKNRILHS